MSAVTSWQVRGTYYESCNCEAICPCRVQGDRPGGDATYGFCNFAVSWRIDEGSVDGVEVAGRNVALAGRYHDDEPGKPWTVVLYVDDRCMPEEREALEDLFLRRLDFSAQLGTVLAVRSASITLDHTPDAQRIEVARYVTVRTREPVDHDVAVSCGIPGHEHPGREIIADRNRVSDGALAWEYRGRTGFATDFAYASRGK